jgi:hypothetical protein
MNNKQQASGMMFISQRHGMGVGSVLCLGQSYMLWISGKTQ